MKFINNTLNLQFNKLDFKFGFRYAFIFLLSLTLNWYLFGLNLALLSAIITTFYFIIPNKDIKIRPLFKVTYIYLNIVLSTFLGYLSTSNLFLSLLLNLLVPFILVCIFTDKTNINGYMFYYALFVIMQLFSLTLDMIKIYLLSIFIALITGYIFEEVIFSKKYKSIDSDIIGFKEYFVISLSSTYIKLRNGLNLDLFISKFAVRLSIATAFSLVSWKYINLPKWYWISISTCFTLAPIYNKNNINAFNRIRGTILGGVIFFICSFFIKNSFIFVILALLSVFLMFAYLPHNRQTESFVFSTYFTLSCSIVSLSSITAITYRVSYIFIGTFIAIVFNKLVLPNKSKIYT